MSTNDGGSAFPISGFQRDVISGYSTPVVDAGGMSLRDYFAGQAMVGLVANPGNSGTAEHAARLAYGIADAMLAERAKGVKP